MMKFETVTDFKNYMYNLINKNSNTITEKITINGWEFKKIKGEIKNIECHNIYTWEYIYNCESINQSIQISFTAKYIKSRDEFKIKNIICVNVY